MWLHTYMLSHECYFCYRGESFKVLVRVDLWLPFWQGSKQLFAMDRNKYACYYQTFIASWILLHWLNTKLNTCLPVYSKEMHLLQLEVHIQDIFHKISFFFTRIYTFVWYSFTFVMVHNLFLIIWNASCRNEVLFHFKMKLLLCSK